MNREEFYATVASAIEARPDLLFDAMRAINDGMQSALAAAQKQRATADAAMLAALSLAKSKRHSAAHVANIEAVIARAISPVNRCKLEEEFMEGRK